MLSHVKVIDLTSHLGAFSGRMLAELGATVIKAEPESGDPLRENPEAFTAWNHGKHSVVAPPYTSAFSALMAEADIVIRTTGIPHRYLQDLKPNIIDVVISGFMPGSETLSEPVSDFTLMARSGLMTIIGDPDRPPLTLPGEQAYAMGAIQAVTGALTALHERALTGKGQLVEVSAFQSAVLANYREPLTWAWTGKTGNRTGNLLVRGKSGVRQVWACKDGFVTWALVDNPAMMKSFVRVMGEQAGELAEIRWEDILVADMPQSQLESWESHIAGFFMLHDKATLAAWSAENGLGLSQIDTPDDCLTSSQHAARELWVDIDDVKYPGPLWASSESTTPPSRRAPELDEDRQTFLGGRI
ncbi:CoA transferase [Alteromonas sp. NFXS44]|uniref:CoA transferase n=1 Tax=Alteromonas sp. NFXS44 TaxID=2818435 RepID=UPI0032DFD296